MLFKRAVVSRVDLVSSFAPSSSPLLSLLLFFVVMASPNFWSYMFARKMVLDHVSSFEGAVADRLELLGWVSDFYEVMVRHSFVFLCPGLAYVL